MSPAPGKSKSSILLDLIRGVAAVLVLIEHWRNIFFVDFNEIKSIHRSLWAPWYLVTSTGHQAVMIFFVLSGYLISSSVFRLIERKNWNWRLYFVHRVLRLWIVLLPGLLLCFLWDTIGLRSHRAPLLYGGYSGNHTISNIGSVHGWADLFRNVFFLQGITGPTYGSDSALWSLSYEFWYYILFPLGLFAVLRSTKIFPRIISLAGFVVVAWFVRGPILEYFLIWLMGTMLALIKPPRLTIKGRGIIAALYLPIYFFFAKASIAMPTFTHYVSPTQQDYLLGVATAFFLWAMLSATDKAEPSWASHGAMELSRFSYTLYVVHIPILVVLVAYIAGDTRWQPNLTTCLYALAILALIMVYAYGVAWLTEFRTDKLRKMIERNLFGKTEAPRRA